MTNAGRSPKDEPVTSVYRDYAPPPHVDPGTHFASGSLDSRARNALVLGVFSLVFGVLTGVPAIWLGRKALAHIDDADGDLKGRGAAWAAIVLGCVGVAITAVSAWIYVS
ncbi:MAG TPA: DUF4190 domain-containing protein [Nocardioides sp.]|jgi:hypothetical protein|nr:DUF4190 domain-containing protein [Nocardioides sp.]